MPRRFAARRHNIARPRLKNNAPRSGALFFYFTEMLLPLSVATLKPLPGTPPPPVNVTEPPFAGII